MDGIPWRDRKRLQRHKNKLENTQNDYNWRQNDYKNALESDAKHPERRKGRTTKRHNTTTQRIISKNIQMAFTRFQKQKRSELKSLRCSRQSLIKPSSTRQTTLIEYESRSCLWVFFASDVFQKHTLVSDCERTLFTAKQSRRGLANDIWSNKRRQPDFIMEVIRLMCYCRDIVTFWENIIKVRVNIFSTKALTGIIRSPAVPVGAHSCTVTGAVCRQKTFVVLVRACD